MVMGNPLPPLGALFVTQAWPFSVAPSGWYAYAALSLHPEGRSPQPGTFLPLAAVGPVGVEDRAVLVNGETFVKADSPAEAHAWGKTLAELRKAAPGYEDDAVRRALEHALDRDEAARRADRFAEVALAPRVAAAALAVHLFAVAPGVALTWGLWDTWLWLLGVMVLLMWTSSAFFFRAHRVLYPESAGERFQEAARGAFFAPASARATDYLARPLMAGLHPLAVAHAVLPVEDFRKFARRVLLDARQPALPETPRDAESAAGATEAWFRGRARAALEGFVRARGLDPEELCAPPAARDATSRSYCPRCDTQFAVTDGVCDACGGIPLRLLPVPATPAG